MSTDPLTEFFSKAVSREPDEEEKDRYWDGDWKGIVMVRPDFEEIERCVKYV